MPHHSTYRRVLHSAIDLSEFEVVAGHYLSAVTHDGCQTLNLDGKRLRGTIPKGETGGLHLLAVQQTNTNAVVAQTAVSTTENEISAAKRLLKQAEIKGKIVSGDALFAQREVSRQVVEQGGDYLWKVKANQQALLAQSASILWRPRASLTRGGHSQQLRQRARQARASGDSSPVRGWPIDWSGRI